MKKIFLFIALAVIFQCATAQNGNERGIAYLAKYNMVSSKDSAFKQAKSIDSFYLEMYESGSKYYSILNQLGYDQALAFVRDNTSVDEVMRTRIEGYNTAETEIIAFQYNTGHFEISEKIGKKSYKSTDSSGIPSWTVHKDTMRFLGLKCQKAMTTFRGRNYTAWFCMDLPFSTGPWRFVGLPGLVLKIYDDKSNFDFECVSLTNIIRQSPVYNQYENRKEVVFDKLKELKKLKLTDRDAFMKMEYPGVTMIRSDGKQVTLGSNTPYNPLDLTN
jgi:GLPGLI family protein